MGVHRGKGSLHREKCYLDTLGQAEALELEGPGEHWRVQSHKEVKPTVALLSSPNSEPCFLVMGDLGLLGEPNRPQGTDTTVSSYWATWHFVLCSPKL